MASKSGLPSKYLPRTALIPAIMGLAFVGAVVGIKMFPGFAAWLTSHTPTVQKPTAPAAQ